MSLIYKLTKILDDCKIEYEKILKEVDDNKFSSEFKVSELYGDSIEQANNILAKGDNLIFMKHLISQENLYGKINLIYVDPPFFSKADYNMNVKVSSNCLEESAKIKQRVYTDTWNEGIEEYLRMICIRLFLMRDLLSESGCIWMHLDWHVAHYVKILMDEVFGMDNFINEIIWNYKSGGTSKKRFARKHDTLLFYGKSNKYYFQPQKEKSYNRGFKPYRFKGVEEFQDELGWYTLVNMKDVWQMDMVGRTSSERTGYATQKPEALLERILESCTKEGDLCADFFGGSGTLASVAGKNKRRWITCDIGRNSIAGIKKRLLENSMNFKVLCENIHENELIKINADIKSKEDGCEVILNDYQLDEEVVKQFGINEQQNIRTILKEDPLSLINYWSVDFNYDGNVHKAEKILVRSESCVDNIEGKSDMGVISILCTDVFGNMVKKIFNIDLE